MVIMTFYDWENLTRAVLNKDDIDLKQFSAPVNGKTSGEGGKKRIQENSSFKIFSLGKKWHRIIKSKSLPNYCYSCPPPSNHLLSPP